jgi:hypothetical protein
MATAKKQPSNKCQICNTREIEYAVQKIDGVVSVYRIGWQLRGGFETLRTCKGCIAEAQKKLE